MTSRALVNEEQVERTGEQRRREGDMSGRTKKIGQEGMEEVKSLGYIPLKLLYTRFGSVR